MGVALQYCDEVNGTTTSDSCGTVDQNQADYRGNISVTASGKPCQRWDSQFPHYHENYPERRPNAGLEENFCRNPDNDAHAWCYTSLNDTRWEYWYAF
jgi:Kringle domain